MKYLILDKNLIGYIDKALKYDALVTYDVKDGIHYYDALDAYKDVEYDLDNDDYLIIEDFSDLVDREIKSLIEKQIIEERC